MDSMGIKPYSLRDNWEGSGRDLEGFERTIKSVLGATTFQPTKVGDLKFFHRLQAEGIKGVHKIVCLSVGTLQEYETQLTALAVDKTAEAPIPTVYNLSESKLEETLAKESFDSNGFLMAKGNMPLYVADSARSTLLLRAGLKGDSAVKPSFYANAAIVDGLARRGGDITMTVRSVMDPATGKTYNKVFSFLSGKYQEVDMNILPQTVRAMHDPVMGAPVTKFWRIDQNFAEVYVEFPAAADDFSASYELKEKVIPGLLLMTSDTGTCSVIARGTARMEGDRHYFVVEEYSHKHLGDITPEEILEAIDKSIYGKLRKLPEALVDKLGKVIGTGDVSSKRAISANKKAVEEALKAAMKRTGLVKVLGARRLSALKPQLFSEIDAYSVYTEYDICDILLGLSDRIKEGLSRSQRLALAAACGRAPFIENLCKPSGSITLASEGDEE